MHDVCLCIQCVCGLSSRYHVSWSTYGQSMGILSSIHMPCSLYICTGVYICELWPTLVYRCIYIGTLVQGL